MGKEVFESFRPGHQRLVCIDSDGCAFDTMEIKHKECFCPAMIKHWGLQPISKYARMAWEFENLYSKDRGLSRFITLYRSIELLKDWDAVRSMTLSFRIQGHWAGGLGRRPLPIMPRWQDGVTLSLRGPSAGPWNPMSVYRIWFTAYRRFRM